MNTLTWKATIKGKEYGSSITLPSTINRSLLDTILPIFIRQMKLSLQSVIFGKNDIDRMVERSIKKYNKLGTPIS